MPTTRKEAAGYPAVGSIWRVTRRSGEVLLAEVVETDASEPKFYVHYVSHDRRLDEWVSIDQFVEVTEARGGPPVRSGGPWSPSSACKRRPSKRRASEQQSHAPRWGGVHDDQTLAERLEVARERMTRVKNVPAIVFSGWEVETWYWSPFPEQYHGHKLYVCDYTLRYAKRKRDMVAHAERYATSGAPRHPPGARVYAGGAGVSLWEVSGKAERLYCQNLCLIAKLFLDHKTLYYDVDPFVFYVLTEYREADDGHHVIGYFSKERNSPEDYNLACILTFPQYQRQGFGTLLISLSYELTKLEKKQGSPEKPLSDLGKLGYRSYWTWTLLTTLRDLHQDAQADANAAVSVDQLGKRLGIKNEDIFSTLHHLNMLRYWKGQAVIRLHRDEIDKCIADIKRPPRLCEPHNLIWSPPAPASS